MTDMPSIVIEAPTRAVVTANYPPDQMFTLSAADIDELLYLRVKAVVETVGPLIWAKATEHGAAKAGTPPITVNLVLTEPLPVREVGERVKKVIRDKDGLVAAIRDVPVA